MTTLEELERLLAGATKGPWVVLPTSPNFVTSPGHRDLARCYYASDIHGTSASANAALIVAAINALPGLIESARRVERLEDLVRAMIESEPDDLVSDGGLTVLDEWRYYARAVLDLGRT
jgi:hypothetical protein